MNTEDPEVLSKDAETLLARLKWLAYIGGALLAVVLSSYLITFDGGISEETGTWGEFGDYVGGVLNPVFSLLALIAVLATFALQIRELSISSRELKNSADALKNQNESIRIQNFESSFFQLLKLHNDITSSIDLSDAAGNVKSRGRDCIKVFVERLERSLTREAANQNYDAFVGTYEVFYEKHQHEIGHYFRLLYNIVKLVKKTENIDQKFYTNIVRAQMSSSELMLLFYNCLSEHGVEKFKPLVEEFALLKTLPTDALPSDILIKQYSVGAFGGKYPEQG